MDKHNKNSGVWKPGSILLDEFEIVKILGRGGMGEVYLVRRLCTDDLFAVKTILHTSVKDDHREHLFLNELRVWLDLPDYPHLCACRFFRTVEDRIAIFAEYVEGESVRKWIHSKNEKTIDMILDVAIQFAWGLHAAHTQAVVHQDVKPDNVLMTKDRLVKV
ncbi:protein kinase, partial [bacterium]|nr:protein kinase [bacterium]